jgi:hypothetical protein
MACWSFKVFEADFWQTDTTEAICAHESLRLEDAGTCEYLSVFRDVLRGNGSDAAGDDLCERCIIFVIRVELGCNFHNR